MKAVKAGALGLGAFFLLLQLVPYGRAHQNSPVVKEPDWDSPRTRELAVRACYDCHSNETRWPWYSHVAPMSWFVQKHVDQARSHLNFSEWHLEQRDADEAEDEVRKGDMPMQGYVFVHDKARLTPEEIQALASGLKATVGERLARE